MNPLIAIAYSFLFGLLHGIFPDEHTWPITFSYAVGAGSRKGMKAGFYFSLGFTLQRAIFSELAYLALAPFLMRPGINKFVYLAVGIVMFAAGVLILQKNRYLHFHLLGHHHENARVMERTYKVIYRRDTDTREPAVAAPPAKWAFIHGFVAGFGFEGFTVFVGTVAAPAMRSAWLGFLPGLMFGIGTMLMVMVIGALFGLSLKWSRSLSQDDIKRIGSNTGGRALFFGGLLFVIIGVLSIMGIEVELPYFSDYTFITIFMAVVAIPAFIYSYSEVVKAQKQSGN